MKKKTCLACRTIEPKKRFDIARCGSAIAPRGSSRPNRAGVRFVHDDVSVCCNPIRKHASSSSEDLHHGIGTRALHRSIASAYVERIAFLSSS